VRARYEVDIVYSHGGPVTTMVRYGAAEEEYYMHVWHPDPTHPDNRVGGPISFSQGPWPPWRYRHTRVLAPGVLGAVHKEEDWAEENR
jgi:hypothetical protein